MSDAKAVLILGGLAVAAVLVGAASPAVMNVIFWIGVVVGLTWLLLAGRRHLPDSSPVRERPVSEAERAARRAHPSWKDDAA